MKRMNHIGPRQALTFLISFLFLMIHTDSVSAFSTIQSLKSNSSKQARPTTVSESIRNKRTKRIHSKNASHKAATGELGANSITHNPNLNHQKLKNAMATNVKQREAIKASKSVRGISRNPINDHDNSFFSNTLKEIPGKKILPIGRKRSSKTY